MASWVLLRLFCILWLSCFTVIVCSRFRYDDSRYGDFRYYDNKDLYEEKPEERYNNDVLLDEILKEYEFNYEDADTLPKRKQCSVKPEYQYTPLDVELTIQTLRVMINFFLANSHQIIADGLFGVRLAQGASLHILKNLEESHSAYPRIAGLTRLLTEAANVIYEKLKNRGSKYDVRFLRLLDRPFNMIRSWRNTNPNMVWKNRHSLPANITEYKSDTCIGQVLGSNADSIRKCVFTRDCVKMEIKLRVSKYRLTHQALYFIAAVEHGCEKELSDIFGSMNKLSYLFDVMGVNMNAEMRSASVTMDTLDLFSEQGVICSTLGFVECTNRHYLHNVLRFVDSKGCITDPNMKKRRQKRKDVSIDGCSQHNGAVVMGYLAHQLRMMVIPPPCSMVK